MSEKNENIEDFVRKVVDQSESQIPFNESHWQQMESLLDAEMPVGGSPSIGYYYFSNAISLLVGAILMWAWLSGTPTVTKDGGSDQAEEVITKSEEEISLASTDPVGSEKPSSQIPQDGTSTQSLVDRDQIAVNGQNQSKSVSGGVQTSNDILDEESEETRPKGPAIVTADTRETEQQNSEPASVEKESQSDQVIVDQVESDSQEEVTSSISSLNDVNSQLEEKSNVGEETNRNTATTEATSITPPVKNQVVDLIDAGSDEVIAETSDDGFEDQVFEPPIKKGIDLGSISMKLPDKLAKVEVYDPDGGSNETADGPIVNRSTRSAYSRFSVGISIAPDLSSNEVFRYNRLGRDMGIVIDYWLTPRLAVSVGAFNTSKRYLVGGEEYAPPTGFWGNVTNGEVPAKIDAECQVLDIPINLKYQLLTRPKLNISASAGVSSYIMLQEDYQYELDNGWKSEWGVSNANQHFFGVGNLQIHFERRFGKNFAFEAAPFFKVPLTGYGHGNIRFHSMGSLFTLRKYFFTR